METFRMIVLLAWGLVVVGMGVRFIWLSITDIRAAWKMLGFTFLAVIFWFILAVITALLTR